MLTHADKQIIARDNALPGLAALLDPAVLLNRLQRLSRFKSAVEIQVKYLRYKPHNSCACTLQVKFADGTQNYYFVKALTAERFAESWSHPKRQVLVRANDPYAPLALFDLSILLQHPAYDRGIRHLDWLVKADSRQHILSLCNLPETEHAQAKIEILRYKPERRLVAKVSLHNRTVAVIRCTNPTDFARMLSGTEFAAALGNLRLLGVDETRCTCVTDWQHGYSLCPEEGDYPTEEILSRIAARLADIHRTAAHQPLIRYGIQEEIKALQGILSAFQAILPEYVPWFAKLAEQTQAALLRQPERFVPIHGDFSLDQVVRNNKDERKLHILDWDRAACGNPLLDLASFQARLELQVIEGTIPHWQATDFMRVFLQAYEKHTEESPDGLRFFTAAALLRLAIEPFRKRMKYWEQYTLQLLQRVESMLHNTHDSHSEVAEKTSDFSSDPLLIRLTCPQDMQHLLMTALPAGERGKLQSAVLRRYKPQRRALIDYRMHTEHGDRDIIGKYRAKVLDKRSLKVQQALWDAGFNHKAVISVAEPLGVLREQNTWLQRKINGQSVGKLLFRDNARLTFLGEAVADALIVLHRSNVAQQLNLPVWGIRQELTVLRERLQQAQTLLPHLAQRIANLLNACETMAGRLVDTPLVSVHRDFYQDQIMERHGLPGHMVLLDLDLLCQGDAALDAGNYLAHIQEFALRRYGDIRALQRHQDAFLKTFLTYETAAQENVTIYTTLSLARHIYLSTQFAERKHTTETLLTVCEMRLAE